MTWVKIDDGFTQHPKIALLPLKARWQYVCGLCYSARYLTDGVIPQRLAWTWEGKGPSVALVEAGLWDECDGVYVIHDYLDWNPSRADVELRKESDRKRKRIPDGIRSDSLDGTGGDGIPKGKEAFESFWKAFPRRVGKPKARTAFDSACKRATPDEIVAGAERYRDDPNREDAFTAHPTTWLNRDGWNDPPLPPRSAGKSRSVRNILALADGLENA